MRQLRRSRPLYAALAVLTIVAGIGSRWLGPGWPAFVSADLGDILWTVEVFLLVGLAGPRWPTARVGAAAWLISFADEVSQLYHAPWIDAIRATTLGGLVLGHEFMWRQVGLYALGAGFCVAVEALACALHARRIAQAPTGSDRVC